jgi:hypothetical protein
VRGRAVADVTATDAALRDSCLRVSSRAGNALACKGRLVGKCE